MKARTQPNLTFALLRALAENWWLLLIRGILAIAFGVLVLLWPDLTLLTLTSSGVPMRLRTVSLRWVRQP